MGICLTLALLVGTVIYLVSPQPLPCGGPRTKTYRVNSDLWALSCALDEYALFHSGLYPENLDVLVQPDEHGYKYVRHSRIPNDPWGTAYFYMPLPNPFGTFALRSFGADGKPGGDGKDMDRFYERD